MDRAKKGGGRLIDGVMKLFFADDPGVPQTPAIGEDQSKWDVGQDAGWDARRPHQRDYPMAINRNSDPQSDKSRDNDTGIDHELLRRVANRCSIMRSIIETRKQQVRKRKFKWRLVKLETETPQEYQERAKDNNTVKALNNFFKKPDRINRASSWLNMLLEDIIVLDAAGIYRRKTFGGVLWALELVDGATIKKLIDQSGRTPPPVDPVTGERVPAYQQTIKGMVRADYTTDELMYVVTNPRTSNLYGFGPVEQTIDLINMSLRRTAHQLNLFTYGNVPPMFMMAPEGWSVEQIEKFQEYWNLLMADDSEAKSQGWLIPHGATPVFPQKDVIKNDEFDEYIARIFCHAIGMSPTPFVKSVNRATAEQQREQADEEGLHFFLGQVKEILEGVVEEWIAPGEEVELLWENERPQDSLKQAEIDVQYVKHGIKSIDEVRREQNLSPIGVGHGIITSSGFVALTPDTLDQLVTATQVIITNKGEGESGDQQSAVGKDALHEAKQTANATQKTAQEVRQKTATVTNEPQSKEKGVQ